MARTSPHPDKVIGMRIAAHAACGMTVPMIAAAEKIPLRTVERHYGDVLKSGRAVAVGRVGGRLYQAALDGHVGAMAFYLKTQGGDSWRETSRTELTGADGSPLHPKPTAMMLVPLVDPSQWEAIVRERQAQLVADEKRLIDAYAKGGKPDAV